MISTPQGVKIIALQIPKSDELNIRWQKEISEKPRGWFNPLWSSASSIVKNPSLSQYGIDQA